MPAWAADRRKPRVLLRNGWQSINIGDVAHYVGMLELFRKYGIDADVVYDQWMWTGMGIAIGLPVLILLGGWADTLRRGRPRLHSSFLYAVAGVLVLLAAVAAGALLVIKPLDLAGRSTERPLNPTGRRNIGAEVEQFVLHPLQPPAVRFVGDHR